MNFKGAAKKSVIFAGLNTPQAKAGR